MVLYFVALIVTGLDQLIKWLVVTRLAINQAVAVIPGALDLFYIQNRGAAFSLFIDQRLLLIIVSLLVMAVIVYVERRHAKGRPDLKVALGLLFGGAAGNLIDRVRLGYVVDYVYLPFIHFPVFNLADSAIVLSILYLFVRFFFRSSSADQQRNGRGGSHEQPGR